VLSAIAAQHVSSPRNAGKIDDATHVGVGGVPGDGPYVRLWLTIQDAIVKKVGYECNGGRCNRFLCWSLPTFFSFSEAFPKGRSTMPNWPSRLSKTPSLWSNHYDRN
jgi:hypothetical protein